MYKHIWKFALVAGVVGMAAASASVIGNGAGSPLLAESRITLTGCNALTGGVHTDFLLNEQDGDGNGARNQVRGVTFSNLDAGCNGGYAHIAFIGNASGLVTDPSGFSYFAAGAGGYDSSGMGNNCATAVQGGGAITGGSVTVNLCTDGSRGPLPDVKNVTGINLVVSNTVGW